MDKLIPPVLQYAVPPPLRPSRPLALVGIAATTVLAGMFVGASTNAINEAVSPDYFISVMGWQDDVWSSSIVQGILEGFVAGLLLSAILTTTIGIITRVTCEYRMGVRWLGRIALAVYALWIIGGILGVGLAASRPLFFQSTFIGVPDAHGMMLRYAWVGGSIWGAYFGGPIAVIVGLVLFGRYWRIMLKRNTNSWPSCGVTEQDS